ncbi:hypothetical protein QCE73_37695 [Caballeronia sp. LZ029]|uniref:hypothetical protein n=1 Tax=Caballeronia sp. LZ029 TaxID=3038564 RepID=UPI00285F9670|nr:hypothetical protein [Caballeronia sp. LZ029]MDR5748909.1 hypothetical protein [Caballeronia sp. LZ029]
MSQTASQASEHLAHTLGKFIFRDLSEEECRAALALAGSLPDGAVIKDFIVAASEKEVARAGLPAQVAQTLAPLVMSLGSIAYAARFSPLFDVRS